MEKKTVVNPNEEIIKKLNAEHEELFDKMTRLANTISDPVKVAKIGPLQVSLLEGQLKACRHTTTFSRPESSFSSNLTGSKIKVQGYKTLDFFYIMDITERLICTRM